jgi:TetR/AcrR family fatty acid metabolism transcriptional regulator
VKKELIAKHALKVFARDGYHNAKVKAIAEDAGIAVGTIYIYFKSKKEIIDFVFYLEFEKDNNYLDKLERMNLSPLNKVKTYIGYKYDCVQEDPSIMKILMQDMMSGQKDGNCIITMLFKIIGRLSSIIRQGMVNGEIKPGDPNLYSFMLFRSVQEVALLQNSFGVAPNREKIKDQLIDFYISGIKA